MFGLPPPAQEQTKTDWNEYLNRGQAMTPGLLAHMNPSLIPNRVIREYPVAVPHPQHAQYAMVERAKKNKAEAEVKIRRQQNRYSEPRQSTFNPDPWRGRFVVHPDDYKRALLLRIPKRFL